MRGLPTKRQSAIDLAQKLRLIRPRDFEAQGLPRAYLFRLSQEGILQRLGRGLYQYADAALDANQSLAEAGKLVPHGVICLLSALIVPPTGRPFASRKKYAILPTTQIESIMRTRFLIT